MRVSWGLETEASVSDILSLNSFFLYTRKYGHDCKSDSMDETCTVYVNERGSR